MQQRRHTITPLFYPEDPNVPPTRWQKVKSFVATILLYYLVVVPVTYIRNAMTAWTSKTYKKRQEKRCETILQSTEDSRTWVTTSRTLDRLRGYERWKVSLPSETVPKNSSSQKVTTPYCDAVAIIEEIGIINALIKTKNYRAMGEFIRTHLHRNVHGCVAPELFRYYSGTKAYVEAYYAAVNRLIEVFSQERDVMKSEFSESDLTNIVDMRLSASRESLSDLQGEEGQHTPSSEYTASILEWANEYAGTEEARMSLSEKYQLLTFTEQSFGRIAIMLSGGASLGMYHVGVVRALWREGLLPRIISGSSAGSIIAAIFCTRSDTDIDEMLTDDLRLKNVCFKAFEFIEDAEHSINIKVRRLMASGAFMDVNQLVTMLKENMGDITFLEAYEKTGRVLNVSVAAADREGEKSMILNYINSPHVVVWSAVSASCAMPGLFTAVPLVQMDPVRKEIVPFLAGQLWFDGSVANDLPRKQLMELFNCNNFIVSQTNPHVIPFMKSSTSRTIHKKQSSWLKWAWFATGREVYYWMMKLWRFNVLPKTGAAEVPYLMYSQDYEGDITIFPIGSVWGAIPDFVNLTTNPTEDHMLYVMSQGLRRTWPYTNHIRCLTEVERGIERELRRLRSQIVCEERTSLARKRSSQELGGHQGQGRTAGSPQQR